MEYSAHIRQIRIDMIIDTPNPILNWFNDIWCQIHIVYTNVFNERGGEVIYYINDGTKNQWIFYQDDSKEQFRCNNSLYWTPMGLKFGLLYTDIQFITKFLVENALDMEMRGSSIKPVSRETHKSLDYVIKTIIGSPKYSANINSHRLDIVLEDISNPIMSHFTVCNKVEYALNNAIVKK